jgi:hypothetical protein
MRDVVFIGDGYAGHDVSPVQVWDTSADWA